MRHCIQNSRKLGVSAVWNMATDCWEKTCGAPAPYVPPSLVADLPCSGQVEVAADWFVIVSHGIPLLDILHQTPADSCSKTTCRVLSVE